MILLIPVNAVVAAQMKKLQISQMSNKDRRTKLMDEILNGMKILKLYAWEKSFEGQVKKKMLLYLYVVFLLILLWGNNDFRSLSSCK